MIKWTKSSDTVYLSNNDAFKRGGPMGKITIQKVQQGKWLGYWAIIVFMRAWGSYAMFSPELPVDITRAHLYFRTVTEAKKSCEKINLVSDDHFIKGMI